MLNLSQARKQKRLQEFIAEQEAAGIGPADIPEFDRAIVAGAKQPQSTGQTSGSRARGDSTEK